MVGIPVAAAVAAAAWAVPNLLTTAPAAALDIKDDGGFWVIEVNDLYANPKVYETQLRNAGLNVRLRLVPAAPSRVGGVAPTAAEGQQPGTRYPYEDKVQTLDPDGCTEQRTCHIGLKIAKDFTGDADLLLGRAAKPGEPIQWGGPFDTRGEPMHCVPYRNKHVSEVRAEMGRRGLTIDAFDVDGKIERSVPDSMYVTGGYMSKGGMATLFVDDEPEPEEKVALAAKKLGCA
ncbi:unnamed protein product [[Actinomadura] parvosata subsp. kistnae]|uniref:hypothetical protein n=1 Tax=[Actinomadura] parvosata TaxID=1955412 RepID=UPI000D2DB045|nr:hypothetical protein [Nonomuraea sp. ATCC 55076]SPL89315.1 unnamed protein product [Actinomadura parvosata subsp. kistnae]